VAKAYTEQDIERSLTALAIYGNAPAARAYLLRSIDPIAPSTASILDWRAADPDRWERISVTRARLIDELCVDEYRKVLIQGTAATLLAIEKSSEELKSGKTRYPDAAAKNLAQATGIAADKLAALLGKPTQIVEHRGTVDVLAAMERDGLLTHVVDGEAVEVPVNANGSRPMISDGSGPSPCD
jgi:hypothetical protein